VRPYLTELFYNHHFRVRKLLNTLRSRKGVQWTSLDRSNILSNNLTHRPREGDGEGEELWLMDGVDAKSRRQGFL